MSLASTTDEWVSPEEYLSDERKGECRHEYLGGRVYSMAGASEEHNTISVNITAALHSALRGKPCRTFMNDMKVRIKDGGRVIFYYPDVMISCGPPGEPRYFKTDPVVIFEVLSPDTESTDRREKFYGYTSLASLQAYVLVEQEKIGVTVFRRGTTGWSRENLETRESVLRLDALGLELALEGGYDRVF